MKIERDLVPESALEDFVESMGWCVRIKERETYLRSEFNLPRFYADLKSRAGSLELKSRPAGFLSSFFGNGETEEEAIQELGQCISERTIVEGAWGKTRREIKVPRIVEKKDDPA